MEHPNRQPILYGCPICRGLYSTVEDAERCRDQPSRDGGWKIGDPVLIPQYGSYQWEESDPWLAFIEPAWPKSRSHFDHQPTAHFWWVVVGIIPDHRLPHRPLVVLYSGGKGAGRILNMGWNPADGEGGTMGCIARASNQTAPRPRVAAYMTQNGMRIAESRISIHSFVRRSWRQYFLQN